VAPAVVGARRSALAATRGVRMLGLLELLCLADMDKSCWSAHASKSFSGMHNEEVFTLHYITSKKASSQTD